MNWCWTSCLLIVCVSCVLALNPRRKRQEKVPEVDDVCLNCICQASSGCDQTKRCHTTADGGYFCGSYLISWNYWHEAGRPGDKGRPHDFETCLNNKTCAEKAVRGYMRKYGRDCEDNGTIDCYDFAGIHKLGYGGPCNEDSYYSSEYYEKFYNCYSKYETDSK